MRRLDSRCAWPVAAIAFVVLAEGATWARAQDNMVLAILQGLWTVTASEHLGTASSAITDGVMTVSGEAFEIHGTGTKMVKGTLSVDVRRRPWQIDLALDGGKRWVGIWELVGDTLKLNYVDGAGQYPRPTTFMTAENADGALVTFQRAPRR
jgi:uncharacterized protein (TIGR03067 family)